MSGISHVKNAEKFTGNVVMTKGQGDCTFSMVFTSLQFVIFFPFVVIIFYALPHKNRWVFLLSSSCYFYFVFIPKYIFLIGALVVIDYGAGILIERSDGFCRRLFLVVSVVANLFSLGFFKYFNFINLNISNLFHFFGLNYSVPANPFQLPLGLSFFIFQSMSYTFDVYYRRMKAEQHLGIYALYVMFFPQLVAGPIERSTRLLPQFRKLQVFSYTRAVDGLRLIMWGFFQKLFIADRISVYVNHAYSSPNSASGMALAIATIFFAFQIFFDFCAYSTIAAGSARILGFNLMKNFNSPYLATSLSEFWQRWHISLSTWFRDYVYYPMGGNRVRISRWILNIVVVFLISGIWHGANWTFAFWGIMNGGLLIVEFFLGNKNKLAVSPLIYGLKIIRTFSIVCVGWIFFRAQSMADAVTICQRILNSILFFNLSDINEAISSFPTSRPEFIFAIITVAVGLTIGSFPGKINRWLNKQHMPIRWALYYSFLSLFISFASFQTKEFIYFQF